MLIDGKVLREVILSELALQMYSGSMKIGSEVTQDVLKDTLCQHINISITTKKASNGCLKKYAMCTSNR